MKGDTRCIEGRLFRHDPQHDDPDLETDIGMCPDCEGEGCSPEERIATLTAAVSAQREEIEATLSCYRNAWVALRMIREAIEGESVGALPAGEHSGVTPTDEAEHIVSAILKMSADVARLREALQFYANPPADAAVPDFYDELDFGAKANEALNTTAIPEPSRRVERETIG